MVFPVFRMVGMVMEKKRRMGDAPSMVAASYSSGEMPEMLDMYTSAVLPAAFHVMAATIQKMTHFSLVRKFTGPTPILASRMFRTPLLPVPKKKVKIMTAAMEGMTLG